MIRYNNMALFIFDLAFEFHCNRLRKEQENGQNYQNSNFIQEVVE